MSKLFTPDVAVLIYVPEQMVFIDQFWGLYSSLVSNKDNLERFHFIVMCKPKTLAVLPKEHCTFFPREGELALDPAYRYRFNNRPYVFANSFWHFTDEQVKQHIAENYKYALRLDVDTFLTPVSWKIELPDNTLLVGRGGYYNDSVVENLKNYAQKRNLPFDTSHKNLGSTWFGKTEDVLEQGNRAIEFVADLLATDPVFTKEEGSWPKWFAGVCLLYGGHLALASSSLQIQVAPFDFGTAGDIGLDTEYVLHSWHSNELFSKLVFAANGYATTPVSESDWKNGSVKHYALWHAKKGQELRKSV